MAAEVRAAGEVVVAVSPSEVEVGEPVEVLLRTFVPIEREGTLPQSSVREPYPAPSGFWNVLMPWDDYPFDVVAQHDADADVAVQLARDPANATLWRGSVSLPSAGTWTIWVRNFPGKEPGSTTTVTVRPGGSAATASPPPDATTTGQASIDARPVALIAALVGLVVGVLAAWRGGDARRPEALFSSCDRQRSNSDVREHSRLVTACAQIVLSIDNMSCPRLPAPRGGRG